MYQNLMSWRFSQSFLISKFYIGIFHFEFVLICKSVLFLTKSFSSASLYIDCRFLKSTRYHLQCWSWLITKNSFTHVNRSLKKSLRLCYLFSVPRPCYILFENLNKTNRWKMLKLFSNFIEFSTISFFYCIIISKHIKRI